MKIYLCTTCDKTVPLKKLGEHREHCISELALEKGGTGQSIFGRIGRILVATLMAVTGIILGFTSFSSVKSMRQLERIPATQVHAVLPGEANLSGQAKKYNSVLKAPKSNTACFYYRYKIEKEERDSDGDRTWRTIKDERKWTSFILHDDSGEIPVVLSSGIDFNMQKSFRTQSGDKRYTEWRIDSGDTVFLFGSVVEQDGTLAVRFDVPGDYDPIVSKYNEASERLDMAGASLLQCWGSLVLLAFAIAFAVRACGVHRLLVFFAILSTVILLMLSGQGLLMMVGDLHAGADRLSRHKKIAENLVQAELQQTGTAWNKDWSSLLAFSEYPKLPKAAASRLTRIRLDLAVATDRVQKQRTTFPENIVATLTGVKKHRKLSVPDEDRAEFAELLGAYTEAKVPKQLGLGIIIGGICIGALSFFLGFRSIRDKRCMENIPTSQTAGAVFGLAEFKGIVGPAHDQVPLTSPMTRTPCVYYHYVVKEKRGSGKNAKWVTITNEKDQCDCTCIDGDGAIDIDITGANVMTKHKSSRREGRYRHTETRLEIHDPLYVIGECAIHPDHADRLYVRKPQGSFPFVLSNLTEKAVTESIAGKGIAQLNVAFASVLLIGLTIFGLLGSFGADDYLTSAMLAPIFMLFVTLVLHFNDLVFLRQRVNRNASNIDVSLKKRSDLLPNLEQIVKSYMSHEAEVTEAVTHLRTAYSQRDKTDPESISTYVLAEHHAVSQIIARMEAYPDLKASREAGMLMRTMVALENEIALMREGYNHAVETYNTRISTLPDMVFAKACGFVERAYIQADVEATAMPSLQLENHATSTASVTAAAPQPPPLPLLEIDRLTAEQLDASAAIYAALLNTETDIRAAQLETIRQRHDDTMVERTTLQVAPIDSANPNDLDRLKHAESWYTFILELTGPQYQTFSIVIRELAEADDVISLFECALQYSVATRIDTPRGLTSPPPIRYDNMELLAKQISIVLSILTHMEDDVLKTGSGAFLKGLAALDYNGDEAIMLQSHDTCTLSQLDAAIDDLRRSSDTIKSKVYEACNTLVADNADYTEEQALILAIIADALNQNRPDWF